MAVPKGPNVCGTLFSLKSNLQGLGRTSTKAYYNLETAISYLQSIQGKTLSCQD